MTIWRFGKASRVVTRRFARVIGLAAALWLIAEYALLTLIAARIGWGGTLTLLTLKGGLGLLLLGWLVFSGATRLRKAGDGCEAGARETLATRAGFLVAAAVLVALPGLVLSCLALALLSPSVQGFVLKRRGDPDRRGAGRVMLDLDSQNWREIGRRKRVARKRSSKAALETNQPTV